MSQLLSDAFMAGYFLSLIAVFVYGIIEQTYFTTSFRWYLIVLHFIVSVIFGVRQVQRWSRELGEILDVIELEILLDREEKTGGEEK